MLKSQCFLEITGIYSNASFFRDGGDTKVTELTKLYNWNAFATLLFCTPCQFSGIQIMSHMT